MYKDLAFPICAFAMFGFMCVFVSVLKLGDGISIGKSANVRAHDE